MEFTTKDIDPISNSDLIYPFKLSLSLIHHFRSFQQENHNFLPKFLTQTSNFLSDFKLRNKDFPSILPYLQSNEPSFISIDLLIIAIHFYFGSIANMEAFLSMLKVTFAFPSLSKSHVNKTNIMTPLTIHDALQTLPKSSPQVKKKI